MSDVFKIIATIIVGCCGAFSIGALYYMRDEIKEVIVFLVKGE